VRLAAAPPSKDGMTLVFASEEEREAALNAIPAAAPSPPAPGAPAAAAAPQRAASAAVAIPTPAEQAEYFKHDECVADPPAPAAQAPPALWVSATPGCKLRATPALAVDLPACAPAACCTQGCDAPARGARQIGDAERGGLLAKHPGQAWRQHDSRGAGRPAERHRQRPGGAAATANGIAHARGGGYRAAWW
jgi:hypothetical protein